MRTDKLPAPAVSPRALLTREHVTAYGIGPGETAFTICGPARREHVENFSSLMRFGHILSMDAELIAVELRGPVAMPGALAFTTSLYIVGSSDGAGNLIPAWRISTALAPFYNVIDFRAKSPISRLRFDL